MSNRIGLREALAKADDSTAKILGLENPWRWVQPHGTDEILQRLADARDYNVPERERENMCSVAHEEIKRLKRERDELLAAMKSLFAMSQPHSSENPWGLTDSPESFRAHVESISSAAIAKITS